MNDLVLPLTTFESIQRQAKAWLASGFLPRAITNEAQIIVIVSKGLELGIAPWRALQGIYVTDGAPELSSQLMESLILERDPTAVIDVVETGREAVELHGSRQRGAGKMAARVRFTIEDATLAGLLRMKTRKGDWIDTPSWKRHPEDMLFNRALSRLARRVWPDVIQGCYVEGEIQRLEPAPVHPTEDTWQGEYTTEAELAAAWEAAVAKRPGLDFTIVHEAAGVPHDWTIEISAEADRKAVLAVLNKIALGKEVA